MVDKPALLGDGLRNDWKTPAPIQRAPNQFPDVLADLRRTKLTAAPLFFNFVLEESLQGAIGSGDAHKKGREGLHGSAAHPTHRHAFDDRS
jgi:hypothetical protein